jgi:hypothetical protein
VSYNLTISLSHTRPKQRTSFASLGNLVLCGVE